MGRGLLSRLQTGDHEVEDVAGSITEHLRVLLNTRQGEAVTAPSFGLIDFSELVHAFPSAIQTLSQSIKATILEYEPRIKAVSVRHIPDDSPLQLKFEIHATLAATAK